MTIRSGFRSGLEEKIQKQLEKYGITGVYEVGRISYNIRPKSYTPDFILPNGILIETKGYFLPQDRAKHLYIKEQYPDLDLRFIFQNPHTRLNKNSKTTYADWCDKHGFIFAVKMIPPSWIEEELNDKRLNALKEVIIWRKEILTR